jgi:hypothetical protein
MIRSGTVLILGAGASAPFGFPCGRGLLTEISSALHREPFMSDLKRQLSECGYASDLMESFARELSLSMQPSVDAFLEKRSEYVAVGKAAMACALIPYEKQARLLRDPKRPHWYEYLFSQMGATLEDFISSELSVITFNYDRSLEHFLFLALKNSYGLSDEECSEQLKAVSIVHVYGTLGGSLHYEEKSRPYDNEVTTDVVKRCASTIRVLHEATVDDPELAAAHKLLSSAEVICFLGFGYHQVNVERLRFDLLSKGKDVLGSAYGVTSEEQRRITRYLSYSIKLGNQFQDALDFLRNYRVFD